MRNPVPHTKTNPWMFRQQGDISAISRTKVPDEKGIQLKFIPDCEKKEEKRQNDKYGMWIYSNIWLHETSYY